MKVTSCRVCAGRRLAPVLDLGPMPAVNYFPARDELCTPEPRHPLRLCQCETCGLAMLDEVVPPEALFQSYHYLTSASTPLVSHFADLATECRQRGWLEAGMPVLDIGANDGTLLCEFQERGAQPLGVDPAQNAIAQARARGISVLPLFFDASAAEEIAAQSGPFGIITGTNVLAHTDTVISFLTGVRRLLAPDGIVIVECAHLLDIIVKQQFDVIYHEHVSYFSLRVLIGLFRACGLEIVDARKVLTQGGSLRVYARHADQAGSIDHAALRAILHEEEAHGIHDLATLHRFADRVRAFRDDLRALVTEIRARGATIVGLGAPAKGVILLNSCGIGADDLAYIVDSTPLKQGRYLPGTRIPVRPEEALAADPRPPDYFLLLSWNFQEAILQKIERYRADGVKVIVPFPQLRVI